MNNLEDCDCCGDTFSMREMIFTGKQFLCLKCYNGDKGKSAKKTFMCNLIHDKISDGDSKSTLREANSN